MYGMAYSEEMLSRKSRVGVMMVLKARRRIRRYTIENVYGLLMANRRWSMGKNIKEHLRPAVDLKGLAGWIECLGIKNDMFTNIWIIEWKDEMMKNKE